MLIINEYQKLNWTKNHGLIPAIVQHSVSGEVLMLGYMNKEAIIATEKTGYVTFFSRSKKRLWTKGETSGNMLKLIRWYSDCDNDTLLIFVIPHGSTCHNNTSSCFHPIILADFSFLHQLENIISEKKHISLSYPDISYTSHLYTSGIQRIAQKVGEEGLETALAAVSNNNINELIHEASDLIYHLLVLLQYKSLTLSKVIQELRTRNEVKKKDYNLKNTRNINTQNNDIHN